MSSKSVSTLNQLLDRVLRQVQVTKLKNAVSVTLA